jgi:HSP20 family protein
MIDTNMDTGENQADRNSNQGSSNKDSRQEESQKDVRTKRYPVRRTDAPIRDMFDRFFDDRSWLEPLPRMLSRLDRSFFPRVDVSETDNEVKVVADVPGVDPENLEIEVRENRVRISGTSEREQESGKDERPYRYERSYGSFQREFALPSEVEEENVKARYKEGVLTIILPKTQSARRKKIAIERE